MVATVCGVHGCAPVQPQVRLPCVSHSRVACHPGDVCCSGGGGACVLPRVGVPSTMTKTKMGVAVWGLTGRGGKSAPPKPCPGQATRNHKVVGAGRTACGGGHICAHTGPPPCSGAAAGGRARQETARQLRWMGGRWCHDQVVLLAGCTWPHLPPVLVIIDRAHECQPVFCIAGMPCERGQKPPPAFVPHALTHTHRRSPTRSAMPHRCG